MSTALVLFLCFTFSCISSLSLPPKRLAGPPEEFPYHRIPDPSKVLTVERSASQNVWFDTTLEGNLVYAVTIPVDGPQEFAFTFASPNSDKLLLELFDPLAKVVDLDSCKLETTFRIGDSDFVPMTAYTLKNTIQGVYTLKIHLNGLSKEEATALSTSTFPNAVITVLNNDNLEVHSHLTSYLLDVGDTIGLASTMVTKAPGATKEDIFVTKANMDVVTPDGKDIELEMFDNDTTLLGVSNTNQGIYAASMIASVPGTYILQARLEGYISGTVSTPTVPFVRTTEHIVAVSAASISLPGTASLTMADSEHAWINLDVVLGSDTVPSLRAYAEVWGIENQASGGKAAKPACWIGGVTAVASKRVGSSQVLSHVISLELDLMWLQHAGVHGPLTLKNVYVSDLDTNFVVASHPQDIPVSKSFLPSFKLRSELRGTTITKQMRYGVNPLLNSSKPVSAADDVSLFLLPGYCSSSNPFQSTSEIFTNAQYFNEKVNLPNDQYAKKVVAFIEKFGASSFGLIGHSQGGFVALHIHNFYFTGLESASGGKMIQTVGTPWGGSSAAGDAANLGNVFGVGCGKNTDLTHDGAALWLTGISVEARKDVHSYTTTHKQGGNFFSGDYCVYGMGLILFNPNDGTTELKFAKLDGGKYEGNTEQQCHTSGMQHLAQTSDPVRNAKMNADASR